MNEVSTLKFSQVINTPAFQKSIANCLNDKKTAQRFTAAIVSAVNATPALQECTPISIVSGALLGESLGLSPSPQLGQFYLVPFKNKKAGTTDAQFILGAKGYIQMAIKSGEYKGLGVVEVRAGEYKGRDRFTGDPIIEFGDDETTEVIGYYTYFELTSGFRKCLYWTKEKMEKHADQYSPAFSLASYRKLQAGEIPEKDMWKYSSYWYKNFDAMGKKTMIRQILGGWGVLSTELRQAIENDEKTVTIDNGVFVPEAEVVEVEEPTADPTEEKMQKKQVSLNDL